jgi:hypothetical protein
LKKAGLTDQRLKDRGSRLPVEHQIQFLNLAANALRDEWLGFHLAQLSDLRELGLIFYVAASSETLGDALRRTARYSSISNEGLSLKCLEEDDIRIVFDYVGIARHSDRHQIEFFMTVLIRLCRQLTGLRLVPRRTRLTHRRSNHGGSELAEYFGGHTTFGARADELTFVRSIRDIASSFSSTEEPRHIEVSGGECNRSAVAARQGACIGDRRETRLEPANLSAPTRIGGRDVFGGSREPARRSGEAIFI